MPSHTAFFVCAIIRNCVWICCYLAIAGHRIQLHAAHNISVSPILSTAQLVDWRQSTEEMENLTKAPENVCAQRALWYIRISFYLLQIFSFCWLFHLFYIFLHILRTHKLTANRISTQTHGRCAPFNTHKRYSVFASNSDTTTEEFRKCIFYFICSSLCVCVESMWIEVLYRTLGCQHFPVSSQF